MARLSRNQVLWVSLAIAWLSLVVWGLGSMWSYAARAGAAGTERPTWPEATSLPGDSSRASLVIAIHPKCPCSRATVEELNRLVAQCGDKLAVEVLFIRPDGMEQDWEKTDLWTSVAAIPGVHARVDVRGIESHRFGAATSGQAILYDGGGHLLFRGGLTSARGHAGDNAGCDAIVDLVNGRATTVWQTPVFGCALFESVSDDVQKRD